MFDEQAKTQISQIAQRLGVETAALLAVAEVESGGKVSETVNGKPMPLIRWEGHYFFRLLPEGLRAKAIAAKLASAKAGGIKNPAKQQARYDLLERAKAIDPEAALSACSWGLGQVMGAHWKWLGFASAKDLADTACASIAGQVELMARFIEKSKLADELQNRDWAGFARGYNGPAFAQNAYDKKMAAAYARYAKGAPAAPAVDGLGVGAKGVQVRDLQTKLRKLGFPLVADGDFGPATRKAIADFQRDRGLPETGRADAQTWALIEQLQGVKAA